MTAGTPLAVRAEVAKLARLLERDEADLAYLGAASVEDLVRLREQVSDALFDGDRAVLQRLASASALIPAQLAAQIAQRALGPVLCARLTGLVEPGKAVDIGKRLPAPFLADVAVALDPRRAVDIIARMPSRLVADVAAELARREETVTLGRFVAFVSDDGLRGALCHIDDAHLLRIAFVMEGKDRLAHVVSLLGEERLRGVLQAAEQQALWPEALDLLGHLDLQTVGEIGELAAAEPGVLDSLARVAGEQGLWAAVLPVLPALGPAAQHAVAELAADLDDIAIRGLVVAVDEAELWEHLLAIAERMTPDQLVGIATRALDADVEDLLQTVLAAADASGLWEPGLRLLAGLGAPAHARLAGSVAGLDATLRAHAVERADALGLLGDLGPIAAALRA